MRMCLHNEFHNLMHEYSIRGIVYKNDARIDLAVTKIDDFRYSSHIIFICIKVSQPSGTVSKLFVNKTLTFLLKNF